MRPNKIPWPPILLMICIAAGLGLHTMLPFPTQDSPAFQLAGAALILAALALDVWASLSFRKAKTTILPHRGSDALVTSGPFQFSRNPIYVGNVMILVGVGLMARSLWPIILAPALAIAVQKLAIEREEAHLSARFGAQWEDYAQRVRRWV